MESKKITSALTTFLYLGIPFMGLCKFNQRERDKVFRTCSKIQIGNDPEFNSAISSDYSWGDFYKAAKEAGQDEYDCFLSMGAEVFPGTNALFATNAKMRDLFLDNFKKANPTHSLNFKEFTFYKEVKVAAWVRERHVVKALNQDEARVHVSSITTQPLNTTYILKDSVVSLYEGYQEEGPTVRLIDITDD